MGKLDGKVALITGGTSGIGRATALLFAREGASVMIAGRSADRGQEVVSAIRAEQGSAAFVACDVQDSDQCQHAIASTVATFGGLDVLFNNAGIFYGQRSVLNTTEAEWDATINTNLKGVFLCSRFAVPEMRRRGGGAIVSNASDWGLVGGPGAAAYCASKGGVVLLTKAMALDHAADNIRVNCVCPGDIDTPMFEAEAAESDLTPQAYREQQASHHPIGRIGTAEEIARAVLFLACDDSSFITGTALPVDGGNTAH